MNIGLIGMPKAGKTTIFNALTGQTAEVAEYGTGKVEPNVGVVTVSDERIDRLSAMYNPKKTIHAVIEFIDFVGVSQGAAKGGLFSGEGMAMIKTADALFMVLRNFSAETLDQVYGAPNPVRDMETIDSELLLADLVMAEKRLEKIQADHQRGKKTSLSQAEEKVMTRIAAALNEGKPLRELEFLPDDQKLIQGYRFLTAKQVMVILNSGEKNYGKNAALVETLGKKHGVIEFAGNFEMELSGLDEADRTAFMADMGITESARARLTKFAYEILGYLSFFTVGEDEVRAWTIHKGETAVEAAGDHPLGPRQGLHPGGVLHRGRSPLPRLGEGGQGQGALPPRRQGIPREGRRHPSHPFQHLGRFRHDEQGRTRTLLREAAPGSRAPRCPGLMRP